MAWSTSEWEIVREIRDDLKQVRRDSVSRADCDRRHPHRKPLVERLSAYLTLFLLVAAVVGGALAVAGLEARLVQLEPAAHASPHGARTSQDAGPKR